MSVLNAEGFENCRDEDHLTKTDSAIYTLNGNVEELKCWDERCDHVCLFVYRLDIDHSIDSNVLVLYEAASGILRYQIANTVETEIVRGQAVSVTMRSLHTIDFIIT